MHFKTILQHISADVTHALSTHTTKTITALSNNFAYDGRIHTYQPPESDQTTIQELFYSHCLPM